MQFVDRSQAEPPIALTADPGHHRARLDEYVNDTRASASQRRAPIDLRFLTQENIAIPLLKLFAGACAYCESPIFKTDAAASVSHHRPPGFAADESGKTSRLHYAWLGYDWENIIAICTACQESKQNSFFVRGERGSIGSSVNDLRHSEQALFLDPCFDDPYEHLRFRAGGLVDGLTQRGEVTIKALQLNRQQLVVDRASSFQTLSARMFLDRQPFSIRPSGGPSPRSSFAIFGPPYPGATLNALMNFMGDILPSSATLVDFLQLVSALPQSQREAAHKGFLAGSVYEPRALARAPDSEHRLVVDRSSADIVMFEQSPVEKENIVSIEIKDFKALSNLSFRLPTRVGDGASAPSMIILGENATGKSTVLEAIALTILGTHEAANLDAIVKEQDLSPTGLLRRPDTSEWDNVAGSQLRTQIGFSLGKFRAHLEGDRGQGAFKGSEITAKLVLGYGPRRYFVHRRTKRRRAPAYRVLSLFDPMAVIPNPEHWLLGCDSASFDAASRALREVIMLNERDVIRRDDRRLVVERGGRITPLSEMSVGYKSVIAMCTDMMKELLRHFDNLEYASAIVLIDEVETHLHPRWKMQLMRRLRKAFPKVQFIVTTHDPLCLQGMHEREVFVLRRDEAGSIVSLENLPSIQGMRAEQILTSEFFGLGSTDPETEAKIELYHSLVSRRGTLSTQDQVLLDKLSADLRDNLVVGNTLAEQALAEGLNQAVTASTVSADTRARPDRSNMVRSVLDRLKSLDADQK